MKKLKVVYVYDAHCSWCFAFSTVMQQIQKKYGKTLDFEVISGALLISALFALSFKSSLLQSLLQSKVLVFFGFISYPLYLIHENAMTSIIIKMPDWAPWLYPFLYPYPAIAFLVITAYMIAKYLEPWLSNLLRFKAQSKTAKTNIEMS